LRTKRKAAFITDLRYDDLSTMTKPIWLRVNQPFRIYSTILQNEFEVAAGFECDGRSSPRLAWGIVPPVGPSLWAAVPHDYLYKLGGYYVLGTQIYIPILQEQADAVYRELLILKGFSKARSWWSWNALRRFGCHAWNEHRRHDSR
jgi:hypothetical protein